jgi:hypothetical protein
MALLFNACRKSSSSMEEVITIPPPIVNDIPIYDIDSVIGTYIAIDTYRTNNGFPFYVFDTTYDTLEIIVSAKGTTMIQFDQILNDRFVYDNTTRILDRQCTKYSYRTYNSGSYYGTGSSFYVNVNFKGDTMFYDTYSYKNSDYKTEYQRGTAVKR